MSLEPETCVIVAPGHNLPDGLKLSKYGWTELDLSQYKFEDQELVEKTSWCSGHPRQICGYSAFTFREDLSQNPWTSRITPESNRCSGCIRYKSHAMARIIEIFGESYSSNNKIYKSNLSYFSSLIIFVPETKEYFWLAADRDTWLKKDNSVPACLDLKGRRSNVR